MQTSWPAYDGASSMSGKTKGAVAHITSHYSLAILNLAVVASFDEKSVCNMIVLLNQLIQSGRSS